MKKALALALCAALLLGGCAIPAAAEEEELQHLGRFDYAVLPDGTAELAAYTGPDGLVIIPNELDGHPISAVRDGVFVEFMGELIEGIRRCTVQVAVDHPYLATLGGALYGKTDRRLIYCPPGLRAERFEIPDGVQSIAAYAFFRCTRLAAVSIPESVTAIGGWAFYGCSGLTEISIPAGVTAIGEFAFGGCDGLTGVALPAGLTAIGEFAFGGCASLTEAVLPDGLTAIGDFAFERCPALAAVSIPESVTRIGNYAFDGCGGLVVTVVPGSYAERWCAENGQNFVLSTAEYGDTDDWLNP